MNTYYSSSSVFLAQKTPNVVNNCRESTAPKSRQTAKIGFLLHLLLLLLSSDGLVQIWLTPSRRCLLKTAAFYTEQSTTPSLFGYFEVSRGAWNRPLEASCATPFSSYVRMRRATLNFELKIVYSVRSECYQVCCYKNKVNKCKMYGDVGLYNRTAKVWKKQGWSSSVYNTLHTFFII